MSAIPRYLIEPIEHEYIEREPTQDDLSDGPVKCWARDGETRAWEERELVAIIPQSMGVGYEYLFEDDMP